MDLDEPGDRVPSTYHRVKALVDDGVAPEEIAARLNIEVNAVPALIELATAKFARASEDARRSEEN